MTDDLRTRIAAAALNAYAGIDTAWEMSEGDIRRRDWLEIADAVIRELGMTREDNINLTHFRYVTDEQEFGPNE